MFDRLTDTLNTQTQALVLRAERQRLIASNIANAETPGYISRDMDFKAALQAATGEAGSRALQTTHGAHRPLLASSGEPPHLLFATASQTNLDNNTVDMDRERASFADNAVKYEATLRFVNGQVSTMLASIKGQ